MVDIADLVRCESDGNNTWFVLNSGEKIFVTRTMKQFEQLLERHGFMRVHQSHLVQMSLVREFQKRDGGYLKLKNGELIPVSVRKRAEVLDAIELEVKHDVIAFLTHLAEIVGVLRDASFTLEALWVAACPDEAATHADAVVVARSERPGGRWGRGSFSHPGVPDAT